MKKNLIMVVLAVMAGLISSEINAQPPWAPAWGKRRKEQQEYYYYPHANVYYSPAYRRYIYPRNGVWVSVSTPHFGFSFSNMPHEVVYSDRDVWLENSIHINRYHGVWHDDRYYMPGYYDDDRRYRDKYKRHRHDDDDDDDD